MKTKNITALWVNLSRAIEIALLGNHTVTVIAAADYPEALEDYQYLLSYYTGVKFVVDGDIICEITKPETYITPGIGDTLENILARVNKAKTALPVLTYWSVFEQLLKTATSRLSLSLKDVEIINNLAVTIARLDGKPTVAIEHFAEAIQYRSRYAGIVCESPAQMFGKQISIGGFDIEMEDLEAARDYLTNRIKYFKK